MSNRTTIRYLIDADAFLGLRSLGLILVLRDSDNLQRPIVMTGYVARHELSSVAQEIAALEACGFLRIEDLKRQSPQDEIFRRLKRGGADKGEAEAIAWASLLPVENRPLFVSVDQEARQIDRKNGVPAGDLMDFFVDLIAQAALSLEQTVSHTTPWLNKGHGQGRPRDFTTFEETLERRRKGGAGS